MLVGPHNPKFEAHEDVLSFLSAYFGKRFGKVRRSNDRCSYCHRYLERAHTECCDACDKHVHAKCLTKKSSAAAANCPACNSPWVKSVTNTSTYTFEQLDPEGFEVYMQWLYSYNIPEYTGTADDHCLCMLRAHLVGSTLEDEDFLLVVRNKIVEIAVKHGLNYSAIAFTYNNTHEPCALRRFLVDLYALTGSKEDLKNGDVSHLFLIDMA